MIGSAVYTSAHSDGAARGVRSLGFGFQLGIEKRLLVHRLPLLKY